MVEKNKEFREKPKPTQLSPPQSFTATDLELSNPKISITDLDREIGTSQSFL
jgi:hypothetical protein